MYDFEMLATHWDVNFSAGIKIRNNRKPSLIRSGINYSISAHIYALGERLGAHDIIICNRLPKCSQTKHPRSHRNRHSHLSALRHNGRLDELKDDA